MTKLKETRGRKQKHIYPTKKGQILSVSPKYRSAYYTHAFNNKYKIVTRTIENLLFVERQ